MSHEIVAPMENRFDPPQHSTSLHYVFHDGTNNNNNNVVDYKHSKVSEGAESWVQKTDESLEIETPESAEQTGFERSMQPAQDSNPMRQTQPIEHVQLTQHAQETTSVEAMSNDPISDAFEF